ncbi:MAG: hypothetical protein JHC61_08810, partial [Burkholderiaceae bacterium]|nr:hypothetical protein [Burkholderiaceae bacterium]
MTGEYEKRRIYKSSASDVDSLFQANPLSELWSVSPALFLQVVAVGLATYSTPLALYYVLSTVIGLQSSTSPSIHFDQVIALIAIIIFGVFVWIAKIKTECALNLKICQKIERKLIASKLQSNALSSMERLIARDFDVVLENLAPALGLVFIPIFLLGISAV